MYCHALRSALGTAVVRSNTIPEMLVGRFVDGMEFEVTWVQADDLQGDEEQVGVSLVFLDLPQCFTGCAAELVAVANADAFLLFVELGAETHRAVGKNLVQFHVM